MIKSLVTSMMSQSPSLGWHSWQNYSKQTSSWNQFDKRQLNTDDTLPPVCSRAANELKTDGNSNLITSPLATPLDADAPTGDDQYKVVMKIKDNTDGNLWINSGDAFCDIESCTLEKGDGEGGWSSDDITDGDTGWKGYPEMGACGSTDIATSIICVQIENSQAFAIKVLDSAQWIKELTYKIKCKQKNTGTDYEQDFTFSGSHKCFKPKTLPVVTGNGYSGLAYFSQDQTLSSKTRIGNFDDFFTVKTDGDCANNPTHLVANKCILKSDNCANDLLPASNLEIGPDHPWPITMKTTVVDGYTESFCIQCENSGGITDTFESFEVTQQKSCKNDISKNNSPEQSLLTNDYGGSTASPIPRFQQAVTSYPSNSFNSPETSPCQLSADNPVSLFGSDCSSEYQQQDYFKLFQQGQQCQSTATTPNVQADGLTSHFSIDECHEKCASSSSCEYFMFGEIDQTLPGYCGLWESTDCTSPAVNTNLDIYERQTLLKYTRYGLSRDLNSQANVKPDISANFDIVKTTSSSSTDYKIELSLKVNLIFGYTESFCLGFNFQDNSKDMCKVPMLLSDDVKWENDACTANNGQGIEITSSQLNPTNDNNMSSLLKLKACAEQCWTRHQGKSFRYGKTTYQCYCYKNSCPKSASTTVGWDIFDVKCFNDQLFTTDSITITQKSMTDTYITSGYSQTLTITTDGDNNYITFPFITTNLNRIIIMATHLKEQVNGVYQKLNEVSFSSSTLTEIASTTSPPIGKLTESRKCTGQPCNYLDIDMTKSGTYQFYLSGSCTDINEVVFTKVMTLVIPDCTVTATHSEIQISFVRSAITSNIQEYKFRDDQNIHEVESSATDNTDIFSTKETGCAFDKFELFKADADTLLGDTRISLEYSTDLAQAKIGVKNDQPFILDFRVKAQYQGSFIGWADMFIVVCGNEIITLKDSETTTLMFVLGSGTMKYDVAQYFSLTQKLTGACDIEKFEMFDDQGISLYSGSDLVLTSSTGQLQIDTATAINKYVQVRAISRGLVQSTMKKLFVVVNKEGKPVAQCTNEILTPSSSDSYSINFTDPLVLSQTITFDQIKAFFGDNTTCPITKAKLVGDNSGQPLDASQTSIVTIDPSSYLTTISDNVSTTQQVTFNIQVQTDALAIGYKSVTVNFVKPNITNDFKFEILKEVTPYFASTIEDIEISNQDENLDYYSPEIKEGKDDNYALKIEGLDKLDCQCATSENLNDKGFKLSIDTSKLTEIDAGELTITTNIYLTGTGGEQDGNKQDFKLKISYVKPQQDISNQTNSSNFSPEVQEILVNKLEEIEKIVDEDQEYQKPQPIQVSELPPEEQDVIANVQDISTGPVDVIPPLVTSKQINYVSFDELTKFKVKPQNNTNLLKYSQKAKKNIKLEVGKVTQNGEIQINFNQKVNVPFNFIKGDSQNTTRLLGSSGGITFDQLNPRNIFHTYLIQKSQEDPEDLAYEIEIKDWTQDKIQMKVGFQNPLSISKGIQNDQVLISIKDQSLFVSNQTGELIPKENLQLLNDVPRQVPHGVNATLMQEQAQKTIGGSMNTWLVVQIVAQKALKGNMDDLLSLYFALQLQCYMIKFQYEFPANSNIYMAEYVNLIEFKILNPQSIIQIWWPEFTFKSYFMGVKDQMEYSKEQRESMLDEMFIFIFFGAVALVILIVAIVALLVFKGTSISEFIKTKLINFKNVFVFNGAIRSFSVSFIKLGIAASIQIIMLVTHSQYLKQKEKISALSSFFFLLFVIFAFYLYLGFNRSKLDTPEYREMSGNLYKGIHLTRVSSNIYYFPTFLLRRFSFFLIPIILVNYPSQQLQVLLMVTIFYIIYFDGHSRFIMFKDNFIYGFNDICCVIQIYHFMCFTHFNKSQENQYVMGYSMIIQMAVMLAVNVAIMIFNVVVESRRQRRLKAIYARKLKKWEKEQEKKEIAEKFDPRNGMGTAMSEWKKKYVKNKYQLKQAKQRKIEKNKNKEKTLIQGEIVLKEKSFDKMGTIHELDSNISSIEEIEVQTVETFEQRAKRITKVGPTAFEIQLQEAEKNLELSLQAAEKKIQDKLAQSLKTQMGDSKLDLLHKKPETLGRRPRRFKGPLPKVEVKVPNGFYERNLANQQIQQQQMDQ